jgi:hypothetical protein
MARGEPSCRHAQAALIEKRPGDALGTTRQTALSAKVLLGVLVRSQACAGGARPAAGIWP